MENNTGDHKFSFPTTTTINPVEEQGASFEFGCQTPDSPKSPADHLFFNGKLQPHIFPCHPPNLNLNNNLSRSTSRTSSNGSMDSLLSSRSNSTGSGSTRSSRSSCSTSSARTSISEATSSGDSKIKINHRQNPKLHRKSGKSRKGDSLWDHYQTKKKPALTPHFSSSRRWQFITPAPGPTLRCQSSLRMTTGRSTRGEGSTSKKENMAGSGSGSWFDRRFFKWFVSACLSCYTTANINSLTDKEYNDVY